MLTLVCVDPCFDCAGPTATCLCLVPAPMTSRCGSECEESGQKVWELLYFRHSKRLPHLALINDTIMRILSACSSSTEVQSVRSVWLFHTADLQGGAASVFTYTLFLTGHGFCCCLLLLGPLKMERENDIPLEEQLRAMEEVVKAGKVSRRGTR